MIEPDLPHRRLRECSQKLSEFFEPVGGGGPLPDEPGVQPESRDYLRMRCSQGRHRLPVRRPGPAAEHPRNARRCGAGKDGGDPGDAAVVLEMGMGVEENHEIKIVRGLR